MPQILLLFKVNESTLYIKQGVFKQKHRLKQDFVLIDWLRKMLWAKILAGT